MKKYTLVIVVALLCSVAIAVLLNTHLIKRYFFNTTLFVFSRPGTRDVTTDVVVPGFATISDCMESGANFMVQAGKLPPVLSFACGIDCQEEDFFSGIKLEYDTCKWICTNKGSCYSGIEFSKVIEERIG